MSRFRDEFYYVSRAITIFSPRCTFAWCCSRWIRISSNERAYRRTYRLNIHILNKLARSVSNIPDEMLCNSMSNLFRCYVWHFPVSITFRLLSKQNVWRRPASKDRLVLRSGFNEFRWTAVWHGSINANVRPVRVRSLYYSLWSYWGQSANDKMAQDAIMWRYLSRRFTIPHAAAELPYTSRELIFREMCFHKETNSVDVLL